MKLTIGAATRYMPTTLHFPKSINEVLLANMRSENINFLGDKTGAPILPGDLTFGAATGNELELQNAAADTKGVTAAGPDGRMGTSDDVLGGARGAIAVPAGARITAVSAPAFVATTQDVTYQVTVTLGTATRQIPVTVHFDHKHALTILQGYDATDIQGDQRPDGIYEGAVPIQFDASKFSDVNGVATISEVHHELEDLDNPDQTDLNPIKTDLTVDVNVTLTLEGEEVVLPITITYEQNIEDGLVFAITGSMITAGPDYKLPGTTVAADGTIVTHDRVTEIQRLRDEVDAAEIAAKAAGATIDATSKLATGGDATKTAAYNAALAA